METHQPAEKFCLGRIFSNAVKGIGRKVKQAFLDNIDRTGENLSNFNTALFNFKAASAIQQAACMLRIGAGVAMTFLGFSTGEPILSMSGPFVAVTGFDRMAKFGEEFKKQAEAENDDLPNRQKNVVFQAVRTPMANMDHAI